MPKQPVQVLPILKAEIFSYQLFAGQTRMGLASHSSHVRIRLLPDAPMIWQCSVVGRNGIPKSENDSSLEALTFCEIGRNDFPTFA